MKMNLYAIYDSVSGTYAQPHCSINDGSAVRSVKDLLRRDENLAKHREDYALFKLGEYDDQTGRIATKEQPEFIVKLNTLIEEAQS